MRRPSLPLSFVVSGLLAGTATAAPVVAVFEVENRAGLGPSDVEALTDYVATQLVSSGHFQVVPGSELKAALAEQKKKSYEGCFDQSCQIEIGRELAAEKTLAPKVVKLGSSCIVSLTLFDLKKATSEAAASTKGGCKVDDVVASLEASVGKLTGRPISAAAPRPPPEYIQEPPEPKKTKPPEEGGAWSPISELNVLAAQLAVEGASYSFARRGNELRLQRLQGGRVREEHRAAFTSLSPSVQFRLPYREMLVGCSSGVTECWSIYNASGERLGASAGLRLVVPNVSGLFHSDVGASAHPDASKLKEAIEEALEKAGAQP